MSPYRQAPPPTGPSLNEAPPTPWWHRCGCCGEAPASVVFCADYEGCWSRCAECAEGIDMARERDFTAELEALRTVCGRGS